jgi:hypothetical protein
VNQFLTWNLALGSNFSLNCHQKVNFNFLRFQTGRTIPIKFALREVSAAACGKQQIHLRFIVVIVNHGVLPIDFNNNKRDKKYLVTLLFSSHST